MTGGAVGPATQPSRRLFLIFVARRQEDLLKTDLEQGAGDWEPCEHGI